MSTPELLSEAIARAWTDRPPISASERAALEPALMRALRDLESGSATEMDQLQQATLNLLRSFPALDQQVREEISNLTVAAEREASTSVTDVAAPMRNYRYSTVEVAYATDRGFTGKPDVSDWYNADRGPLSFGTVQVRIPDDARMGKLDQLRIWPLSFRRDRRQRLESAGPIIDDPNQYVPLARGLLERAPRPEFLIFIHGYNVSFEDAVLRTAQIAYDLQFQGVPMLYSWPSDAATLAYLADGERAAWAHEDLTSVLRLTLARSGCTKLHLIGHSMGNRPLTESLTSPDLASLPVGAGSLGQVAFAAPDIDASIFGQRAKRFTQLANQYTLYVSDRDLALNVAQRLAQFPRAGQAGDDILVLDGIDTIDASQLDTGLVSHSYVGAHKSLIYDLFYLINLELRPDERAALTPTVTPAGIYWTLRR